MKLASISKLPLKQFAPLGFSILVFIGVAVSLVTIIIPKIGDLWNRFNDLPRREKEVQALQTKRDILEKLSTTELTTGVTTLTRVVPSEKDIFGILTIIDGLARKTNGSLLSYAFNPGLISTPSADIERVPFSLSLLISQSMLAVSLETLYSSVPIITIPGIKGKYHAGDQIEVEYELETYVQGLPQSFGTLTGPVPDLTSEKKDFIAKVSRWQAIGETSAQIPVSTFSGRRRNLFSF